MSGAAAVAASSAALDRRLRWLLAALCLAAFAALAPHLVYPDLNLDYPFVDGDSHDWIANGLRFAGSDVRYSGRPPLLPLALALLDRLGLLRWWPVAGLACWLAAVLGFHDLAARLFPAAAAFAAALLLLADFSLQGLALDLMADVPCACLILWSARAFLTAGERPRRYAWSGLLAGLGGLVQPAALLLPLAAGATLWARRRRDLASRWPWIGAALAAACQGAWMLVRRFGLAAYGESLKDPWHLFGFHLSTVRFYLFSLASLLGLPACLLLAAGIVLAVRRAWRERDSPGAAASLFAVLLFASLAGFIVFCYLWNAKRFMVYAVWPAGLLIAEALAALAAPGSSRGDPAGAADGADTAGRTARTPVQAGSPGGGGPQPRRLRTAGFAAAAALAIGGAALPLPEPGRDGSWAALSPLPPLAAHLVVPTGPSGAPAAAAATEPPPPVAVALFAPANLAAWSTFGRAAGAWAVRPRGEIRPDPGRFAGASAALYLYDRPQDGGGRYRTITRLSNALRKPVRFVPRSVLAPYRELLAASPPIQLTADYTVYTVALPGIAGSWLVVTSGGRPLDPLPWRPAGSDLPAATPPAEGAATDRSDRGRREEMPGPAAAADADGTGAASLARAAAEAAAITAWVGRGNAYVALFPPADAGDPAALYLLFLLRTTELYVVEPQEAAATRALLARSPVEAERRIDGASVLTTRVAGQRTAVIAFDR
jgi:hypothetical protein